MGVYKKPEERYEETRSSAYTFLIVGGIGLILDLLGFAGILPLPFGRESNTLMLSVMGILFVACLVFGVYSMKSAKKISEQVAVENAQTEEILTWFQKTIAADALEAGIDTDFSEEERYFKRLENIKDVIIRSYGELEESYLDKLADDLYLIFFSED